jgi:hypothetical protein
MPIVCPCCNDEDDLIIYPKIPIGLNGDRKRGEAIVTEKTDVCCLNCYWQGTLTELRSNEEIGKIQMAKKRVEKVLDG